LWLGWGFRAHQPWRASVPASRPDPKRRHAAALQNALTPRHTLLPCSGRATAFPPGQEKLISGLFLWGMDTFLPEDADAKQQLDILQII
jgi:hypothetical protein